MYNEPRILELNLRKNFLRKKVFLALTVIWAIIIFGFSARNGTLSTQDSNQVGMFVAETFVDDFSEWDSEAQSDFAEDIEYPIRKTAHATEYAILGILIFGVVYDNGKSKKKAMLLSWGIATCYAATDEIHQLFVPGRSGMVTDVCIDSTGAIAGILLASVFVSFFKKKITRKIVKSH